MPFLIMPAVPYNSNGTSASLIDQNGYASMTDVFHVLSLTGIAICAGQGIASSCAEMLSDLLPTFPTGYGLYLIVKSKFRLASRVQSFCL